MGVNWGMARQFDIEKYNHGEYDIRLVGHRRKTDPECEHMGCPSFPVERWDGRLTCDYHEGLR